MVLCSSVFPRKTYTSRYLHDNGMVGGPEFQNLIKCWTVNEGAAEREVAMEAAATAGSGSDAARLAPQIALGLALPR